ncbi:MAG: hypothetical protein V5A31_05895 [Haloferacaceae archaeon]
MVTHDDSRRDETRDAAERHTDRLWLMLAGLLLVTMPAFTLVIAYAVLRATRSALLDGLTAVEVVELYLVETVMFAVFGYLLYRLTLRTIRKRVD